MSQGLRHLEHCAAVQQEREQPTDSGDQPRGREEQDMGQNTGPAFSPMSFWGWKGQAELDTALYS